MFVAGFDDGSLLVFDKEAEDQSITIPSTDEAFLVSKPPPQSKQNPRA